MVNIRGETFFYMEISIIVISDSGLPVIKKDDIKQI